MQARIGRLRGGFCVYWTDDAGKRRRYQLQARTRKEAEAEALDVIRRETKPQAGATVRDLWEAYRAEKAGRPVTKTMGYVPAVLAHFGALRPDQVTVEHCRAYTRQRRADGRHDGTIWTELGLLRTALVWAQNTRLIAHAPLIERPAKPAPKDRWLSHDEIDRMLAAATMPHIRLAIVLMLTTAGRVGAILDLTWDRVDFERGVIDLRLDGTGPRKGRAVVPMNALARAALSAAQEAALSDYVVEWAGDRVRSIRRGFETAAASAELDDVTMHSLRHTAAVHMAAAGVDMERISQYLGHSNVNVTRRIYARFAPDHLRDAAEVLDFGKLRAVR